MRPVAVQELIRKENPTHIAVVFDTSKPTERHLEYPEYKAHRDAMPDGIRDAIKYIDRLLIAYNIPKIFEFRIKYNAGADHSVNDSFHYYNAETSEQALNYHYLNLACVQGHILKTILVLKN